jgi:fatty-acid peroxygenase
MLMDQTLPLATDAYLYLSRRRRRTGKDTLKLRLMGREAMCLVGREGARFFYDGENFDRRGVVPPHVQKTLFGDTAVHLLDGPAHRHRKAMFVTALDPTARAALAQSVRTSWAQRVPQWRGHDVVLFDAAAEALCAGVHDWCGMPLEEHEVPGVASDLVAMVDGFASAGPRYFRGRRARTRQEHRVARYVADVRAGRQDPQPGTPLAQVAFHRDHRGKLLDEHTAAVELLNLLRPTVAITWFVAYSAHALHHYPRERSLVSDGGDRARAFAHEVRRFYPFAPFLGARAVRDLNFDGVALRSGELALLDIFGHNHHPAVWPDPWQFSSDRHLDRAPDEYDLIPQGGGDVRTGHRCPGEPATIDLLAELVEELAQMPWSVPEQDLRVTRHRVPARVCSGMILRPSRR